MKRTRSPARGAIADRPIWRSRAAQGTAEAHDKIDRRVGGSFSMHALSSLVSVAWQVSLLYEAPAKCWRCTAEFSVSSFSRLEVTDPLVSGLS